MALPPLKLGIVGEPSSGKDTVAAYLKNHYGFTHLSTSDFIRFYILQNNLGEPTRPFMQEIGDKLRAENGADYLMQLALKSKADHLIISGLRNPAEALALKKVGGIIIALKAPIEQRYEWSVSRNRVGDHISFEDFQREEKREELNEIPSALNVKPTLALADYTIDNYGSVEELYKKIDELLEKLKSL